VVPDTVFGILGALAGPVLTTTPTFSYTAIFRRLPLVVLYTWSNLIIFNLANQRNGCVEDALNKPGRLIPSGRMTPSTMRKLLLAVIPFTLAISWILNVWQQTSLLIALTWMYNDLGGGDDVIMRATIIAGAFFLYNIGALQIACGDYSTMNSTGYVWTALISGVILTTMHVQDIDDQEGDKAAGRLTAPLWMGDTIARWTVAIPVVAWSALCPAHIGVGVEGYLAPCALGLYIAGRTLLLRNRQADGRTWEIWAGWLICLYTLPLLKSFRW